MFPKMQLIRQVRPAHPPIGDVDEALRGTVLASGVDLPALAGRRVGIAVGSRGIDREPEVVRVLVSLLKENGARPEIFAAMGCHGDGTAEGQREMLASLGITEENVGAPISTCAESKSYGTTESGIPVYGNTLPFDYDAVILVNRVKMHTDFEDVTESGLLKLLAIGVGNPRGCVSVHSNAMRFGYGQVIRETAAVMIDKLPIILGIMLTENWQHHLDRIEAVLPKNFVEKEIELLAAVKAGAVRLPVTEADALIVAEIGKDISGTGMDTKVIGRIRITGQKEPDTPRIKRVTVLGLTEGSHGNAIGIGLADLSTMAVHDKINIHATSLNAVSSMAPQQGCLPCFVMNDRDAVNASVDTLGLDDPTKAHVLYIQNTNLLEHIAVSLPLYEEHMKHDKHIEAIGEPFDLEFDDDGRILHRWDHGQLVRANS